MTARRRPGVLARWWLVAGVCFFVGCARSQAGRLLSVESVTSPASMVTPGRAIVVWVTLRNNGSDPLRLLAVDVDAQPVPLRVTSLARPLQIDGAATVTASLTVVAPLVADAFSIDIRAIAVTPEDNAVVADSQTPLVLLAAAPSATKVQVP